MRLSDMNGGQPLVRVLGPVEVVVDGQLAELGGERQRRLLAALTIDAGRVVAADRLADRVWGDGELPGDPRAALRTYLSRLRRSLGGDGIVTGEAGGWRLDDARVDIDARRFTAAVAAADDAALDVHGRLARLDDALAMWGGDAYDDVAGEDWARHEADRLNELRVTAIERRYEAMLAAGMHTDALPGLVGDAEAHPLRDRLVGLQMLALFRAGRQAEATRVFQVHRRRLADELGLEPSDDLVDLDRRIVAGDPSLHVGDVGGRALRGYRLGEQLGEGAFAVVYRGTQPSVGRDVAVKIVRAELANRPEFVRRFEAEGQLVARLEHPFIVPLYDFWREPDRACLVFRYLRGGTLEARLTASGGLSVDDAAKLVTQVGAALAAAHAAGVVHRDVKPANVFLDEAGNFYLGDFGIALEAAELADPTAALSAGSPAYASPEQLRREPIGPSADVHGLGISVWEALTARLPFPDARTQAELLQRQLHDPVPSVRDVRSDLPPGVDDVLGRATAKDPADRYQRVEDFVEELLKALDGNGHRATATAPTGRATTVSVGEARNPYKGLRAFTEADSADFHGRERLIGRLVDMLRRDGTAGRIAAVVGPSGIGKSSVVKAGLIPALRQGAVPGSDRWFVATMLPSGDPFDELSAALLRVATRVPDNMTAELAADHRGIARVVKALVPEDSDAELLLVIDQFEELFTLVSDDTVRGRFLAAIEHAVTDARCPVRVVLTLRADFWDRPLRHGSFARLIEPSSVHVTALAPDELERAIVDPAHRTGCEFEPGLVSEIVADVTDQPGALPLLQYALTELWERRVSGLLTREAYAEVGGVTGALARRAEELYGEAAPEEQSATRRVFERLVTLGEGTEDTRRRALRSELGDSAAVDAVVDRYGRSRLLSFDHDEASREPTVEVAHEALIRQWPRLRTWLDEDRDDLRLMRHLTAAAAEWQTADRPDAELYRGGRLEAAEEWLTQHPEEATGVEREFVETAAALRSTEQEVERRTNRRLRRLLTAIAIVAVIALLAGVTAFAQRQEADDQRDEATTQAELAAANADVASEREAAAVASAFDAETKRIGAQAVTLMETNPRAGLLLAAEAHRRDPSLDSLGALQGALSRTGNMLGYTAVDRSYFWIDGAPEGELIAAATEETIEFFDAASLERIVEVPLPGPLPRNDDGFDVLMGHNLAIAPTGDKVAFLDGDGALWVATTTGAPHVLASPGAGRSVVWSRDGGRIAVGLLTGEALVLDARTGRNLLSVDAHPERSFTELGLDAAAAGPFGQLEGLFFRFGAMVQVAEDGTLWTTSGPVVRSWSTAGEMLVDERMLADIWWPFSARFLTADGSPVLSGHQWTWSLDDATTTVVQVLTGRGPDGTVNHINSAIVDDNTIVSLNSDGRLSTYDRLTGNALSDFIDTGLEGASWMTMAPDGDRILVASSTGIGIWSMRGDGLIRRVTPREGHTFIEGSDDGQLIATGAVGSLEAAAPPTLWRLTPAGPVKQRFEGDPPAEILNFAPGTTLIEAWSGHPYYLSSIHEGETLEQLYEISHTSFYAVDAQRRRIAYGRHPGADRRFPNFWVVTVFDLDTGEQISPDLYELSDIWQERVQAPSGAASISSMAFSADGSRLWVAGGGALVAWDTSTWELSYSDRDAGVEILAVAPVSGDLVAVHVDGSVEILDPDTMTTLRRLVSGETIVEAFGERLWISPDENWLITTYDRVPRLFHYPTGQQVGGGWPADPAVGSEPAGNADGMWLATALPGEDLVAVWDLDVDSWPEIACRAAGRNMTPEEWEQFGPRDEAYAATCPQWPGLG